MIEYMSRRVMIISVRRRKTGAHLQFPLAPIRTLQVSFGSEVTGRSLFFVPYPSFGLDRLCHRGFVRLDRRSIANQLCQSPLFL